MVAYSEAFNQAGYSDRAWIGMIGLSIVFHALFFLGIVFMPELSRSPRHMPVAVEVDLVSLPMAGPQTPPPSAEKAAAPPVKAETSPAEPLKLAEPKKPPEPPKTVVEAPPAQEAVSLAPKPLEVKKSVKKKTYDASKVISRAVAKIEEQAPESRPRSVIQAIDQMKKEVQGATGRPVAGGAPGGAGIGRKGLELIDIYHAEIWSVVRRNWTFPEVLAQRRTDLQAIIQVKIMRDGKLADMRFETKSGNSYFDDSVWKAVKKSDPLPPLPKAFPEPYDVVNFRFSLAEMLRRSP